MTAQPEERWLSRLAVYLEEGQSSIVDGWMEICEKDDALQVVSKLTRNEFRNNVPAALKGLCRLLSANQAPSKEDIRAEIAKHGHHRWKLGFSLFQLIRDWGHLNRVLVGHIEQFFCEHSQAPQHLEKEALNILASFMTEATSNSVQRFDELRRAEAASMTVDVEQAKAEFEKATQARGEMLRQATHDLRGSLTAVEMSSRVVKLSSEPNASQSENLDLLDQSIATVKDMLESLLDLSRLESGEDEVRLEKVNIAEVFERLAEQHRLLASENGLKLETEGPAELFAETDAEKVRRIAQNLMLNALQHTSEGRICLAWKLDEENERWELRVIDTGSGIQNSESSPVALELNNPNSPHKAATPRPASIQQGEGIGLTIVKRLCDLLDTSISLESEIGSGSVFILQFPLKYDGR